MEDWQLGSVWGSCRDDDGVEGLSTCGMRLGDQEKSDGLVAVDEAGIGFLAPGINISARSLRSRQSLPERMKQNRSVHYPSACSCHSFLDFYVGFVENGA